MPDGALTGPSGPALLLVAAVALTVLAVVLGIGIYAVVDRPRRRLRKRMQTLGLDRPLHGGARRGKGRANDPATLRQRRIQEKLQELEKQRANRGFMARMRGDLLEAGYDYDNRKVLAIMVGSGILAALVLAMMGLPAWMDVALGLFAGFGLPKLVFKITASRRRKKFLFYFADSMDILVRGLRSGLPVGECLNIIAREMPDPVGGEFRQLVEGQKLGMSLDELMRRGMERFPTAEYRFFAIVLQIQQQTGGNLAETLAGLANVLRERKKLRDKIRAMSSEARASAGIIGSLPFVVGGFVYLLSPDYVGLLFSERLGNVMLAAGLLWMATGIAVMAKMINFRI